MNTTQILKKGKPIPGFPSYLVLPDGRVYNTRKAKFQSQRPIPNANGYFIVVISEGGNAAQFYVHKLVAEAFVPNPDPDNFSVVRHNDGNRANNNKTNLRWTTHAIACRKGRTGEKVKEKVAQ